MVKISRKILLRQVGSEIPLSDLFVDVRFLCYLFLIADALIICKGIIPFRFIAQECL